MNQERLTAFLNELQEFLEDQQDVVDGADGPRPNKAMHLLTELKEIRGG